MRKLFTGLLLTAALPAFASVTSDIEAGELAVSGIITNAVATCGSNAVCQDTVIEDAIAAGIDVTSVINLAIDAGIDPVVAIDVARNAALDAGQSQESITAAITASNGFNALAATAGGNNGGGFNAAPSNNGQTAPGLTTTTEFETGEGLITTPIEDATGPTPGFPDPISPAS
jgi:hypothetical protein